jgi:hypothetical protein
VRFTRSGAFAGSTQSFHAAFTYCSSR